MPITMTLSELKNKWNQLGKSDPLWAILSDPSKRNKQWKPEAFFATGESEVQKVLADLERLKRPLQFERVLDFGCGVGRLAGYFLRQFESYTGVDISPSMIAQAKRWNRNLQKAGFQLNDRPDLSLFESNTFDLIYCNLVLQHMDPQYSRKYIEEFVRIVKPEGLILFQIPALKITRMECRPGCSRMEENLPEEAFRSSLSLKGFDGIFRENVCRELSLTVFNQSDFSWPAWGGMDGSYWIRLGNHWLFPSGGVISLDDGRSFLPRDLPAHEAFDISLTVVPPPFAGKYLLEFEMVQEGNVWFSEKGQSPLRIEVEVLGKRPFVQFWWWKMNIYLRPHIERVLLRLGLQEFVERKSKQDDFEMHGIPLQEVLDLIKENQAELIEIQTDQNAGVYWTSHTYLVKKCI
jgi:SAM-dependent methyltransferase